MNFEVEAPLPTGPACTGQLLACSDWHGVREDMVDFMFNLMGVVFVVHRFEEATLELKKRGFGRVVAGDIATPHYVQVLNNDHLIAHLEPGGMLDLQIHVGRALGYQPAIYAGKVVV